MGAGADLLEKPLDDLRTVIRNALERERAAKTARRLRPTPSAASTGVPSVYLVYDQT